MLNSRDVDLLASDPGGFGDTPQGPAGASPQGPRSAASPEAGPSGTAPQGMSPSRRRAPGADFSAPPSPQPSGLPPLAEPSSSPQRRLPEAPGAASPSPAPETSPSRKPPSRRGSQNGLRTSEVRPVGQALWAIAYNKHSLLSLDGLFKQFFIEIDVKAAIVKRICLKTKLGLTATLAFYL